MSNKKQRRGIVNRKWMSSKDPKYPKTKHDLSAKAVCVLRVLSVLLLGPPAPCLWSHKSYFCCRDEQSLMRPHDWDGAASNATTSPSEQYIGRSCN